MNRSEVLRHCEKNTITIDQEFYWMPELFDLAAKIVPISRYTYVLDNVKKSESVLDVGCGTGYGTNILHREGRIAKGIDTSNDVIRFAKAFYPEVPYEQSDIMDFPLSEDEPYDWIAAIEMLEHQVEPATVVEKMLKVATNLVCCVPYREFKEIRGAAHIQEFDEEKLRALFPGKEVTLAYQVYGNGLIFEVPFDIDFHHDVICSILAVVKG